MTAEMDVQGGRVEMFSGLNGAFAEDRGFAAFVRHLQATDAEGRALALEPAPESSWTLVGFDDGPVRLSYDVDLGYARRNFETGNEQIALLDGKGLFLTGFALFITPTTDVSATVAIEAPQGWDVTTSWTEASDRRFVAGDKNRLLRNILAVGRGYSSTRLSRGGVDLRVLLFGKVQGAAAKVESVFLPVMDYFESVFGGADADSTDAGHFTFAILPGPNDGEGYIDSFASSQPGSLPDEDRLVWANSLAHEFFHFWNGSRISSTWEHYPERQWFSEGFTEYYANRALLATGVMDQATYDEILSQYASFHLLFGTSGAYADVTMEQAGRKKGLYRPGVYDSGVVAAFCLDGAIRRHSRGTQSLDDAMQLLDRRFGLTGRPLVIEDIVAAFGEIGGEAAASFIDRHVRRREPMPVAACARDMGYRAIIDGYHVLLRRVAP